MLRNRTPPPAATGGRLFRLGGLAGLWVGVLLCGVLLFDRVLMPRVVALGRETLCPRVTGLPLAQAEQELARLGLQAVVDGRLPDPGGRVPAGHVLDQYPHPGRATKTGRRVHLTLSSGGRQVRTPSLRGVTLRQAQGLLADAQLLLDTLAQRWRHDERYGEGTVLSQIPAPGDSLPPGGRVSVVVSLGPPPEWVSAPALAGLTLGQARRRLERAGLALGFSDLADDSVRLVLEQAPPPGTPLAPGSAVDLRFHERSAE